MKAKPLIFAGVVVSSLIVVGAARLTAPKSPAGAAPDSPPVSLETINQVVAGAKAAGHEEGVEAATAPPTLDASLATRAASLTQALELSTADVDNLVCARATQYAKAAADQQATASIDVERWLLAQLGKENDAVKALMAARGSMDGSAGNATALDSPLRNRAAILAALNALYTGDPKGSGCRVAAFDSSTQVDAFLFQARRIKEAQSAAVTELATEAVAPPEVTP